MAGGTGDPLPEFTDQPVYRLHQFRDGMFREVSNAVGLSTESLPSVIAALNGLIIPGPHKHQLTDLPAGILGVAVGTSTLRPEGFSVVMWIAPAEPINAAVGDIWLNDPDS